MANDPDEIIIRNSEEHDAKYGYFIDQHRGDSIEVMDEDQWATINKRIDQYLMKNLVLERKLTLDGVAIILAAVSCLIYIGHLQGTIDQLSEASRQHTFQLTTLQTDLNGVKSDVSVLSTIVVERTGKPISK
jgi:hypothetical protein